MVVQAVSHKDATVLVAVMKELKKTIRKELKHPVQSCASVRKVPFYMEMIMIA